MVIKVPKVLNDLKDLKIILTTNKNQLSCLLPLASCLLPTR